MFLGNVIFTPVSNFLMSNFNGFCMVLTWVRNEEFENFMCFGLYFSFFMIQCTIVKIIRFKEFVNAVNVETKRF